MYIVDGLVSDDVSYLSRSCKARNLEKYIGCLLMRAGKYIKYD